MTLGHQLTFKRTLDVGRVDWFSSERFQLQRKPGPFRYGRSQDFSPLRQVLQKTLSPMISVPFPRAWNLIFIIPNSKLACYPGKPYKQFGNSLMISQGFALRQFQALLCILLLQQSLIGKKLRKQLSAGNVWQKTERNRYQPASHLNVYTPFTNSTCLDCLAKGEHVKKHWGLNKGWKSL